MTDREATPLVRAEARERTCSDEAAGGRRCGVFYGWVVVATITVILTIATGARFLFGVVLKPVSEQFGWDRAALTGAVLVAMIALSICQPLLGALVDRLGPKRILVGGCLLLGVALIPLSFATELWQIYVVYGLLTSVALAATSPVVATALVSRWFRQRRGLALSIATSGSAFGQLLIVPTATWVLTLSSWQMTYRLLAVALLAGAVPLGLLLLRNAPPPATDTTTNARAAEGGVGLTTALRTFDFWFLAFGFVVCGWTMAFPNTHFVAYADDMGMSVLHAANVVAVTAAFSIGGSVLLGLLADRHPRPTVLALTYALRGLAFALLLALPNGTLTYLYAVVLGVSWTATTPLTAAIAADRFGPKHVGVIFGSLFTFMNLGFGVGAFAGGLLYERTGGYGPLLVANVVLGIVGAVGAFRVGNGPLPELAASRRGPSARGVERAAAAAAD